MSVQNIEDGFIKIGDLELVNVLEDNYKLLIDDSTNGDTKAALVSVLKEYLVNDIKPSINEDNGHWYIGDVDTGITVNGVEFRYNHPDVQYCISGTDNWINLFDITVLMPNVEIDEDTLCWKINGVLTDKSAVNARINSMNGNVSIVGAAGIVINNNTDNNTITISRTDEDAGIPPADVSSKVIHASDGQLIIKWTEPSDLSADGITYSVWSHTILVRKIGSYPVDEQDGDVVVINHIRNQYAENGYVDSGLTNGIKYYYKLFLYSEDGVVNRNPKNNMIGIPKKYSIYGVRIDETNSNPETALTYTDDAVGMKGGSDDWDLLPIFANIQPCLLKDGQVQYYLKKDDYNYKANGVDLADLSSGDDGDVMVEFPKIAYMIYREGNYLYVKITDDPDAKLVDERFCFYAHTREVEGDRQKLYISAYMGFNDSGKLRSLSGKSITGNQTIGNFRTLAQTNGDGYDILSFYPIVLIQCLYIIKYKNLNSQLVIGRGGTGETGILNTNGFTYGIPNTNGKIKLFGIEDFWGNLRYWIDGLFIDANRNILTAFKDFNDTGAGYVDNGQGASANIENCMSKPQGTSQTGFIAKEVKGSQTTYFCDYTNLSASSLPLFSGVWDDSFYAGAFYLRVNNSASYAGGGRLMYL